MIVSRKNCMNGCSSSASPDRDRNILLGFVISASSPAAENFVLGLKKRKIEISLFFFSFFSLPSQQEEHFAFVRSVWKLSELESENCWEAAAQWRPGRRKLSRREAVHDGRWRFSIWGTFTSPGETGAGETGLRSLSIYDEHIPFFSSEDSVQDWLLFCFLPLILSIWCSVKPGPRAAVPVFIDTCIGLITSTHLIYKLKVLAKVVNNSEIARY